MNSQEQFKREEELYQEIKAKLTKEHEERKAEFEAKPRPELSEKEIREDLFSYIYDAYKDVYGFKPRWMRLDEISTEELEKEAKSLSSQVLDSIARDDAEKAFHHEQLEKAKNDPDAIIVKNEEFDEYPYEHPGHYEKTVYIPEKVENNIMKEKLLAALSQNEKPKEEQKTSRNKRSRP